VGILRYALNITGKEIKINFLPVLYIRTPSEQGLTPKTAHWPKPGQAYFRENASLGWYYPTDIKVIGNENPSVSLFTGHTLPCCGHT
jgi:hypothetical protein